MRGKDNSYILYMMDEFSKYMKGTIIRSKSPEDVIKKLNSTWLEDGPGPPSKGFFFRSRKRLEK